MPVRLATWADLVPIARILAVGFQEDPLLGELMHPKRARYPNDMYLYFLRHLRVSFYAGHQSKHLVSYSIENGIERITGYAHWMRIRWNVWAQSKHQVHMTKVMKAWNLVESLFQPNRAFDRSKTRMLDERDRLAHQFMERKVDYWYLSLLAVDPAARKRGIGRQLASYGLEESLLERVAAGVVASLPSERFFVRAGFDIAMGPLGDVDDIHNPFKNMPGGQMLFNT